MRQISKLPILVLGDLNARSYTWENYHNEKVIDRDSHTSFIHGRLIEEMCITYDVNIHNTGLHTRYQSGIYSSPDITLSVGKPPSFTWLPQKHDPTFSDHHPILLTFNKNDTPPRKVWDFKHTNWTSWSKLVKPQLLKWEDSTPLHTPPELAVQQYNNIITENAKSHIPKSSM